ncbi:uncharacterized protein [Rutidosis leptorrhynchoides]|uniref:uncharacterized protein n=1 Tax=Rutidosis leptorrhynchoides TaxID=125765 RepID=UPI003A9A5E95
MKYSFFPELSYCFGATPVVEPVVVDKPSRGKKRMRQGKRANPWKPMLTAIAEDGNVRRETGESRSGLRSDELKRLVRSKVAGKNRSDSYGSDDYRNSAYPMALPAFSPTPFVF